MTTTAAAVDLLSALVLEDGRRWGEAAVEAQWEDAVAVLSGEIPYHFLTRARGYSKTTDLGGIAIAVMLAQLEAASRLYGVAADQDQGQLLIDSIAGFAARTPEISNALDVQANRVVATNGSVLKVLPADDAGAWGLRPAFLIVDEIAQWGSTRKPKAMWSAASSAMAKIHGSRMVVLTSAGDPAHWSRTVIEQAVKDPLWRVHEVKGAPPWADPDRLNEQRRRLPASVYARLFENIWTASEDRLTSPDDLRACVLLDGDQPPAKGANYVCGLDLGLKNDRTVAAICHSERVHNEGFEAGVRVPLDRMRVWQGTRKAPVQLSEVEEWIAESSRIYRPFKVVFDPYQAIGMAQRLRRRGVAMEEFTFSQASVGKLASTLHVAIREHQLALPDDAELLDELANVRLREVSPGVMRMDHDSGRHDDRAIALALAVKDLLGNSHGNGAAFMEAWRRMVGLQAEGLTPAQRAIAAEIGRKDRSRARNAATRACPKHFWMPPMNGVRTCAHCPATQEAAIPA